MIFWSMEERKQLTPNIMNDEQLHQELRKTSWDKYNVQVVDHYPELLEKITPRYAKIRKSIEEEELSGSENEEKEEGMDIEEIIK